jgi:hypothetical protein
MKIVALIGEPAAVKSTLARRLISSLSPGIPFRQKYVAGTLHPEEALTILGTYAPGEKFPGTDRLSMGALPAIEDYLIRLGQRRPWARVFFEGDRLASVAFFQRLAAHSELKVVILEAPDPQLRTRHIERGSRQSEAFLRGRRTKVENIRRALPCITLSSAALDDLDINVEALRAELDIKKTPEEGPQGLGGRQDVSVERLALAGVATAGHGVGDAVLLDDRLSQGAELRLAPAGGEEQECDD